MEKYEIGDIIREYRKKCNLTQEDLALKLNISDKSISKWEMGVTLPSINNLKLLAEIFDITLDELLVNKNKTDKKVIKKIVLTGGPCAGKTTAMSWLQNYYEKQGYKVIFVPESPTNLIISGINYNDVNSNYEFESLIFDLQLNTEQIYDEGIKYLKNDKILIVYDRGLLDVKPYMSKRDFNYLLKTKGFKEIEIMERYDAVFHLVTAAKGAKEFYNLDNPARRENASEAIRMDDLLINAWTGHQHLRIIDNSTDFENKMKRLMKEISAVLGEPKPYEIERKFLIEIPDINYLEKLDNCEKIKIVQTYLKSNDGEEIRIRQRGVDGSYTYSMTKKIRVSSMKRIEIENRLTQDEYLKELYNADPNYVQIIKDRYCLSYKNQYFEIDIYHNKSDIAICEIELLDKKQEIIMPKFLKVIKEVTDSDEYENHNIAKIVK